MRKWYNLAPASGSGRGGGSTPPGWLPPGSSGSQRDFDVEIATALASGDPDLVLEGRVARALRAALVRFHERVWDGTPPLCIGEIDVETHAAIIEVTTATRGRLGNVRALLHDQVINPTSKPVILYAERYNHRARSAVEQIGGYVVHSERELLDMHRRLGGP